MPDDLMPKDPGNLNYSQATALGLYGPQEQVDASKALTTYSPTGPALPPNLGDA